MALLVLFAVLGVACVGVGVTVAFTAQPRASAPDLASGPPPQRPVAGTATLTTGGTPAPTQTLPPFAASPLRLALPTQRVRVPIVAVGVDRGVLTLPADPQAVGWWAGGAAPGDPGGSAVLAGHLDSVNGGVGALAALLQVRLGDPIEVDDAGGTAHRYRVTARHSYPKADLPDVLFRRDGAPRLVLITCGGTFDARTRHYSDNIVVIAAPAAPLPR